MAFPPGPSKQAVSDYIAANGLAFGTAVPVGFSTDVKLFRDAAASLALRNGVTAQAFRVYNTFTDASNYERGVFDWTTNATQLTIATQKAGTGAARAIFIDSADALYFRFAASSNIRFYEGATLLWFIQSGGHFISQTDNTMDIGASGASRPRTGYFGTSVVAPLFGAAISTTTFMNLPAGVAGVSPLRFIQGIAPTSPVDGDMWREDNTNTGLKIRINGVTKTVTVG